MAKYRKKIAEEIEAIQYNNINKEEVEQFVGCKLRSLIDSYHYDQGLPIPPTRFLFIPTPGGEIQVNPGDYVIRNGRGEFYPCNPNIFKATYEEVVD